jgi:hypothetical protein
MVIGVPMIRPIPLILELSNLGKSGTRGFFLLEEFHARYQDPHYWTSVITFTANWGRRPV